MKICIKKRKLEEFSTIYILIIPFLFSTFIELLKLPSAIKYTVDIAVAFSFFMLLMKQKRNKNYNFLKLFVFLFVFYCIINGLIKFQNLAYILWGFRNNFRFYIFFFACVYFLNAKTVDDLFLKLDKVLYVHIVVLLIQFFVFGYNRDNLGGLFGVRSGCNAWLNIFSVIVVSYTIIMYLNNRYDLKRTLLNCVITLISAAMAELKFFFVEFIVIAVLSSLVTKFTWKKFAIIIGTFIGIILTINLLIYIFPEWSDTMSIQGLLEVAMSDKGYTSSGDMNRLTFLNMSNQMLDRYGVSHFTGMGLGNCEYSDSIIWLKTPFYQNYEITHYTWLSLPFFYLENGYIGLLFYIGFFVVIFCYSYMLGKKNQFKKYYFQVTMVISVMCLLISVYNVSMKMECAYMMYFMLAVPFIIASSGKNRNMEKKYEA